MAFHDGTPVEFLYRERVLPDGGSVWLVQPIFVEAMPREEVFRDGDRLTPIHTRAH
jgi:hypothetical protein